ncbi:hypothetical protein BH11PSE10_BH11PSE10_01420 [soil metagenome]
MRNHPIAPRIKLSQDTGMAGMAWVPTLMLAAVACAALLVAIPAEAATPASAANSDAAARYQQERAVCMNGQSNQDRTTCLKEAGAAYAEAKHGGLRVTGNADGRADRAANATQRCTGLPADDAKACMARMRGEGSTSGTVASGGILRELVTVAPAASAASAAVK